MADKPKPKTTKRKAPIQPVESILREDGDYVTQVSVLKEDDTQGVAVRTGKKQGGRTGWRKTFFINEGVDAGGLLFWVFRAVRRYFKQYWHRDVVSPEDVSRSDAVLGVARARIRDLEDENTTLHTRLQMQERNAALAREVGNDFGKYEGAIQKLEEVVKDSVATDTGKEGEIVTHLRDNRWLLGLDCEVRAKNRDLDAGSEVDLHIVTTFGENRIIEDKSPNLPIFKEVGESGRINITPELAKALSELVDYMHRTHIFSGLKIKGVYAIQNPVGIVIAGYNLNEAQREMLSEWNFYLGPYIQIVTYDELLASARRNFELIKGATGQPSEGQF